MAHHADQALELFPNQSSLYIFQGTAYHALQKSDEAIYALEQGLLFAGNQQHLRFEALCRLGEAHHQAKNYAKSDSYYEQALIIKPEDLSLLNNYAYYLTLRKENLEKAKRMASKLIEKEPNNLTYLDTYGWVLYTLGDYSTAKQYLEKAATHSSNAVIIEHYGDLLFQLGAIDQAIIQWKKAKSLGGEVSPNIDKKISDKRLYE
jgi:tetratricopeptide (TPR) repeat protein